MAELVDSNSYSYKNLSDETIESRKAFYRLRREDDELIDVWLERVESHIAGGAFPPNFDHALIDKFISELNADEREEIRQQDTWSFSTLHEHFGDQKYDIEQLGVANFMDSDNESTGEYAENDDQKDCITDEIDIKPSEFVEMDPLSKSSPMDIAKGNELIDGMKREVEDCEYAVDASNDVNGFEERFSNRPTTSKTNRKGKNECHKCRECGRGFRTWRILKQHSSIHSKESPYICDPCRLPFTCADSLRKHLLNEHGVRHQKEHKHKCPECGIGFSVKPDLQQHLKTHKRKESFVCDICKKSYTLLDRLKQHLLRGHQKPPESHLCSECGKCFSSSALLKQHSSVHSKELPYICEPCGKSFRRLPDLKKHLLSVHQKLRARVCHICGKSFKHLKIHFKIHTKPFECELCEKSFCSAGGLKMHLSNIHQNLRPYQCSECPRRFSQICNLKTHFSKIHQGTELHECCGEKFSTKKSYKQHLKTHIGKYIFKCDVCKDVFTRMSNLERHVKIMHIGRNSNGSRIKEEGN